MVSQAVLTGQFIRLAMANFCYWASLDIFLPILPQHYHSAGFSDYQVGIVIGAISAGALLFKIVAGKAVDRYGGSPVVCIGLLLTLAAIAGYPYANSVWTASLSTFIQGVGLTCYSGAALTMATLMFENEHTTDVFALFTMAGMFGASLALAVANWVYVTGGMPAVAVVGGSVAALCLLLVPKKPASRAGIQRAATLSVGDIAGNPGVYIPTISLFATNMCSAGAMTYLPILMLSRGVSDFSVFFVSYAIVVIIVRLFIRRLCEVVGAARLETMSVALMGMVMFLAAVSDSWHLLSLCGMLMGVALGVAFPAMGTTVTACTAPVNRGTAFGVFTTAADFGFVIGATGLGFIAAGIGYAAIFVLAGAYTTLYAIVHRLWLVKKLDPAELGTPECQA
ncbi:MAG TPA: MFS transporter [Methylomusa anaerophila]|uniref:Major facilitator superfamily transporter n=1 Tax=Methylomusa anaerophila TaxID=1930071 RepID=A0A348AK77_9FIRM|nr:MFS transporter [Methylomusa anaerophila]BBB91475.1 major facilitator superfamily transporter [Methylomusa anaerophila]HML89936.1 MFS transporter [Methylomusa anaerophila]